MNDDFSKFFKGSFITILILNIAWISFVIWLLWTLVHWLIAKV